MTPTLSVARDAFLESATIADVLDLARTMALERLARGLPVAWVGPGTATPLAVWLAVVMPSRVVAATGERAWSLWRNGVELPPASWQTDFGLRGYFASAVAILDGDATRAAWGA